MSFFNKIFGKKQKPTDEIVNPEPDEKKFDAIKGSIYPYFKQVNFSNQPANALPKDLSTIDPSHTYALENTNLVMRHVCEDLYCMYVIDVGDGLEIIQQHQLVEWDIDEEQLHDLSLENFRALLTTKLTARGDTNGMMFTIDGNLEAGLVLIDEIWEQLEEQVGEAIVISVPSRDVIVATGKSNREMIDAFTENSKTILQTGDHPLSGNWFIRVNNKWQLFEKII